MEFKTLKQSSTNCPARTNKNPVNPFKPQKQVPSLRHPPEQDFRALSPKRKKHLRQELPLPGQPPRIGAARRERAHQADQVEDPWVGGGGGAFGWGGRVLRVESLGLQESRIWDRPHIPSPYTPMPGLISRFGPEGFRRAKTC